VLDAMGQRHLERIRAGAQRMASLIDDLLHLSRVSRTELRREPVDLAKLARATVAALERNEPDRKVSITIPDELPARGDPKLLSIVFDNLIGNAWKFTGRTNEPKIELGYQREERVFFVRDNGAGFDIAYRDKLFGVFQRLHKSSEFPGTGIGLATVRRIIERHGGRVWAEGELGKGATFYFTLSEAP
jgi:signal transduction histidine kinase